MIVGKIYVVSYLHLHALIKVSSQPLVLQLTMFQKMHLAIMLVVFPNYLNSSDHVFGSFSCLIPSVIEIGWDCNDCI